MGWEYFTLGLFVVAFGLSLVLKDSRVAWLCALLTQAQYIKYMWGHP